MIDVVRPIALDGQRPDPEMAQRAFEPPAGDVPADEARQQSQKARHDAIIKEALERFQIAADADREQRERELDDLRFEAGDQWPAEYLKAREASIDPSGHVVPAKPCLTINKLDQPIQQVINEARQGRLAIQIKPKGEKATKDNARIRQGLIRNIEVESRAQLARLWALDRAAKCGRGAYRIMKAFANDGDFDMDLIITRILNQHSVYLDPFAQQPDWSDGLWGFITADYPEDEYKRRWDQSSLSLYTGDQLTALGDGLTKGWVTGDSSGKRVFRVAEYFRVVFITRRLLGLQDKRNVFEDELPDDFNWGLVVQEREVDARHVEWFVINAVDVLDEELWEGRYIPIIPVIGKEYNVAGKRMWKGIVSNAKDAQRSYNVMRSEEVTAVGLTPKSPYIMAEGQDEGYKDMWDNANTRHYTRLIYRPVVEPTTGQLAPPPARNFAEPAIQGIVLAARDADADIKATTGRFDPSLGRPGAERSGKAIRELKVQGETGTSNYLDNLATMSMSLEGMVLNDMLEHVYDREERIVKILDEENREEMVMLNAPYRVEEGRPVPITEPDQAQVGKYKRYDLKGGSQFGVVVSVGQSFATRRDEGSRAMSDLAQAAPQLVPTFADLWIGQMDFPGAREVAERLERMNPHAQKDDDEAPEISPQMAAQIQALQAGYQQAMAQIAEFQQEIQAERAKQEGQAAIKREEFAHKERLALLEGKIALIKQRAEIQNEQGLTYINAEIERMEAHLDRVHEREMAVHAQARATAESTRLEGVA